MQASTPPLSHDGMTRAAPPDPRRATRPHAYRRSSRHQGGGSEAGRRRSQMPLTGLAVDDGPHSSNGLLLHAWDGPGRVTAFISRRAKDDWGDRKQPYERRKASFAPNTAAWQTPPARKGGS